MTQNTPAPAELVKAELHWPEGARFTFHDDGGHNPCYVVMPDGAAIPINHWDDDTTDIARAKWIIAACNAAIDRACVASDDLAKAVAKAIQIHLKIGQEYVGLSGLTNIPKIYGIGEATLAAIAAHQAHMASDVVCQMDREQAAITYKRMCDKACEPYAANIVNGECDHWAIVQEFAAHRRAAATTPQPDPRYAEIETLRAWLQNTINVIENGDLYRQQCCDGHMCGCQGSTHADEFVHYARAALANSEATHG